MLDVRYGGIPGVRVGVRVGVGVTVGVDVLVGVRVGVTVGVRVGVRVGFTANFMIAEISVLVGHTTPVGSESLLLPVLGSPVSDVTVTLLHRSGAPLH